MKEPWQRNLYVIWIATFASMVGGQLAMPFIPLFINRDLGVTDPGMAAIWAGIANAGQGIVMAVMSPIWGVLADRHGRKPMLVRAQFAIGATNAIAAFTVSPWQFVTLRWIQGGFSGVVGASRALVAGSVPRERVAYSMGLIQAAIYSGQSIGPAIGGVLGSAFGFRLTLLGTGVINAFAGTLALLYIKEEHKPAETPRRGTANKMGLREMMRSRPLATLCLVFYLGAAANAAIRPVLALLLAQIDPTGDVAVTSGIGYALLGIAGTITSITADRFSRRMGLRAVLVVSGLMTAGANVVIALADSSTSVLVSLLIIGLGQGAFWSSSAALVSLFSPASRQGTAFGVLTSAQALANGTGPLASSLVASAVNFHAPFAVIAGAMVVASALGWTLPPTPVSSVESGAA
jgi:DHA1 family multidrug resistance protein-like MFS transporter